MGQPIFDGDSDNNSESNNNGSGDRPVLSNDQQGAAAWINTDKNGNAYLSVRLPLGLGSLNLFPADDRVEQAMNQLADYLEN